MKLVRYQSANGTVGHGILTSGTIAVLPADFFGPTKPAGKTIPLETVTLMAPIEPPNLLCLGKNFRSFAGEVNPKFPGEPLLFLKTTTAVIGPEDGIALPNMAPDEVYFEAELAVVIGKTARHVAKEKALECVLGYTVCNDIGAKDCQARDGQWARAKSFDTFAPMGPWIETQMNPSSVRITSKLNGKLIQDSNTSLMLFDVPTTISYLSQCMTLLPGTVISMGSPGVLQEPRPLLRCNDIVEAEVEGIGILRNVVGK
jgi:2-keto-4-pentenoate hydratase/2-oxohepta-3-ene-1,7-dioic acid hydratase in catechol pathway